MKAKVKNIIFTIPDDWDEKTVMEYWNEQASGIIVVCPVCNKIDIDITTHFDNCDKDFEEQRQNNLEYYD